MQTASALLQRALSFSAWVLLLSAVPVAGQPGDPQASAPPTNQDWPVYLGSKSRTLYSTLNQINKSNVARLGVAWTYDTGDRGEFQANSLVINGVLYTASPTRKVIALDAATGKEIWRFDPTTVRPGGAARRQRGLVYWESGDDHRIFTGAGPVPLRSECENRPPDS